jgi:hypothetical protein
LDEEVLEEELLEDEDENEVSDIDSTNGDGI